MERLPENKILKFYPDTLETVRKAIGFKKSEDMSIAVNILEEWVKQQSHFFKKDFSRHYLEMIIVMAKGSLERAKVRLDNLCTFKTSLPQFFIDDKIDFKDLHWIYCLLPNLTKEHDRIFFFQLKGKLVSPTLLGMWRIIFMIMEYVLANDYYGSLIVIADLRHLDVATFIYNLNLVEIREVAAIILKGSGFRIKGIHSVTQFPYADIAINIFKQIFGSKLIGKLRIHMTMESVFEIVPKDVMPKDYGGMENKTLLELHNELVEELSTTEQREFRREMRTACTDESRRQVVVYNEQHMGMPGTFRNFSID